MRHRNSHFAQVTGVLMAGALVVALVPAEALASEPAGASDATAGDSGVVSSAPAFSGSSAGTIDDELIVTYKAGKSIKNIVSTADVDADGTEKLIDDATAAEGAGRSDISLVRLDDGQDADAAVAELERDPRVESVEKNMRFTALATTVNDYYVTEYPQYSYYLQTEKVQDAWDLSKTEGKVTVAVLDSGITKLSSRRDADLEGNVDYDNAYDALSNRTLSSSFEDTCGHGTAVSELIAAQANNGKGIAGTSYDAKVLPVRVLDSSGSGDTAQILRGYNYVLSVASRLNVKVVNMSIGGETDASEAAEMSALQTAVNTARDAGILTVAAAGNDGDSASEETGITNPVEYPAALDHVVAVGAVDSTGTVASFSEHHDYVDITAAGVELCVPWFYSETSTSRGRGWPWFGGWGSSPWMPGRNTSSYTYTADTYGVESGTSFSAPIVSGVAALLYASDATATAAEVENALETSATDRGASGKDRYYGHGELNALAALEALPGARERVAAQVAAEQARAQQEQAKRTAFGSAKPKITSKKRAKKSLKVGWGKLADASGYRVYYRAKGKKSWKSVSTTKRSKSISKLKRKTSYQIRVRGYLKSDGMTVWSKYSSTTTLKTK